MRIFTKRINKIKIEAENKIKYELLAEYHFRAIAHIINPALINSLSLSHDSMFIYIYPETLDEIELELIPKLSEIYSYGLWKRFISEKGVSYEADFKSFDYFIHPRIYYFNKSNNACVIKSYPTGRTITTSKTVEVKEPEMEFKILCSD